MAFTVPTEACQAQFLWTGVQASFPCGFPALDETDLDVAYSSQNNPAASFTASIVGGVLLVTAIASGTIEPGLVIDGADVEAGTLIVGPGPGGGVGAYPLNLAQNVASEVMTGSLPQTLALGTHYTAALDPVTSVATVTPIAMPDNGPGVVTVTRDTPATQGTAFSTLDATATVNALQPLFDQFAMAIAEVKRRATLLEAAAFGPNYATPTVITPKQQYAVTSAANLPIPPGVDIVTINAAADLTPEIPAAASRNGLPLTVIVLSTSHQQTYIRSGADTFDTETTLHGAPDSATTFMPFNDNVNNALGYKVI